PRPQRTTSSAPLAPASFLLAPPPAPSTLSPYPTLFRSLTSSGRRAINLLTHDQLFSAKSATRGPRTSLPAVAEFAENSWSWVNRDRKSTRLNSSHLGSSYAVFRLRKKSRSDELGQCYVT